MLPRSYSPISPQLKDVILTALGPGSLVADMTEFDRDASELRAVPELVVRPQTVDGVQQLMRLANIHGFPVTPRGGGSGLAGGCLAVQGGVVLCLKGLNQIRSIDTNNLMAEVEAGVISKTFKEAVRAKGLFYPPDPAGMDLSTIGGNAATNAGGPSCVKYGTTKDYILGLEVVMPSGDILRTGTKTRKGVVGYDLTHLLVGSEGTLGIITSLSINLLPHPAASACTAVIFPDLHKAIRTVAEIMGQGHSPAAIEFLDHRSLQLVGELLPFQTPGNNESLLLIECDGEEEVIHRQIGQISHICRQMGATNLVAGLTPEDRERIWHVRRQVSLRIHEIAGLYLSEDVAVPISKIPDLVAMLPAFERKFDVVIYAFGHAGDGNIHLNITAKNKDQWPVVEQGARELLAEVLRMDGTISGEHGIGAAKKMFLSMELSKESIRLQSGIKQLFDPQFVLNPGKIFPDSSEIKS